VERKKEKMEKRTNKWSKMVVERSKNRREKERL